MISAGDFIQKVSAKHLRKSSDKNQDKITQKKHERSERKIKKSLNWRDLEWSDLSLSDVSELVAPGDKKTTVKQKYNFLDSEEEDDQEVEKTIKNRFLKSNKDGSVAKVESIQPNLEFTKPEKKPNATHQHKSSGSGALDRLRNLELTIQKRGEKLIKKQHTLQNSSESIMSIISPSFDTDKNELDVIPVREKKYTTENRQDSEREPEMKSNTSVGVAGEDSVSIAESSYKPVIMNLESLVDVFESSDAAAIGVSDDERSISNDVEEKESPQPTPVNALALLGTSSKSFVNLGRIQLASAGDVVSTGSSISPSPQTSPGRKDDDSIVESILTHSESNGSTAAAAAYLAQAAIKSPTKEHSISERGESYSSESSITLVTSETATSPKSPSAHKYICSKCSRHADEPKVRDEEVQTDEVQVLPLSNSKRAGSKLGETSSHQGAAAQPPVYLSNPPQLAPFLATDAQLTAWINYNPTMLLMNSLMKQQLELTRQVIYNSKQSHHSFISSLAKDYQYTTWKDTQKDIKKHRKPTLTFEEALKKVDDEMESDKKLLEYLKSERERKAGDCDVPAYYKKWSKVCEDFPDESCSSSSELREGAEGCCKEQQRTESVNDLLEEYLSWFRKSPFDVDLNTTSGRITKNTNATDD